VRQERVEANNEYYQQFVPDLLAKQLVRETLRSVDPKPNVASWKFDFDHGKHLEQPRQDNR
jgi:hypothetical protein